VSFYSRSPEEDRLLRGLPQLESYRTRQLIERLAPAAPAVVVDIGGAAGAYAIWLAEHGYTVHLVDVAPRLVDEAKRRASVARRSLASCRVADARDLPFDDASADIALLLGPLYHLTEAADRERALQEAFRILAPGGILFVAAITRWAYALYGLMRDLFAEPHFRDIVDASVQSGIHRPPAEGYFTTSYFHRPEELRAEIEGAGFVQDGCYGLEGPSCMLADFNERWQHPRRRADIIRTAELVESEPSLLGMSPHILAVARRP
jgi:ubiquinone/menaquinone biosynthesis C-methylase UbiE